MLRPQPTPRPTEPPSTVTDRELGLAAFLLLLAMVLTVAVLPAYL